MKTSSNHLLPLRGYILILQNIIIFTTRIDLSQWKRDDRAVSSDRNVPIDNFFQQLGIVAV